MADESVSNSGSQISSNIIIAVISSLFIVIIIYPWIIAVTIICFIIGFTGLDHLDIFIKSSISSGRFGPIAQTRFKDYINLAEESESQKNVIKEVTVDPLRDFIQETEQKRSNSQQQQHQHIEQLPTEDAGRGTTPPLVLGNPGIHNTLIVPTRISSSSKSSPEKTKPVFDSPKRSLSAASSRRVSEDIPGSASSLVAPFSVASGVSGIFHQARDTSSKTPSPSRSSNAASTPSPSLVLNPEIVRTLKADQEFRVGVRVDKAFGRLFTNIINYYISPSWAPYETRRQLKLCFKQLLNSVAEQCSKKLLHDKTGEDDITNQNAPTVKLAREKLLPLLLHYLDKTMERGLVSNNGEEDPILSKEGKRRIVLKIRKFCRQIFEKFLNKDDRNCKLWKELCIAVLADGVLVNVMHLGRDKLPELLEELVMRFKKSSRASSISSTANESPSKQRPPSQMGSVKDENEFVDPLSDNFVEALQQQPPSLQENNDPHYESCPSSPAPHLETEEASKKLSSAKVPFLLDSFLDPPFNFEKPDPIVSRWRPTLKDIVSETDLLYPLIQYMKHVGGQQSLVYLQGVLDEFPQDGDPYCRRVLELEYLPGFCRSSLFLETMGLSRVEMAMEVGADPYAIMRRNSNGGHTRSASYGGPSSSSFREFLKIEQGIVDGLPLTESSQQNLSISSSSSDQSTGGGGATGPVAGSTATLPVAGDIQPNLAFKRRPHLEMYIAKFIKSTSKSWKQYYDPLAEQYEPVMRAGIEAKSYEEWDHPEVNSRVKIESSTGETYDSFVELVTSLMRSSPIASPFFAGLANFLKPYLMPIFNEQLDQNLTNVLSEDLLVTVVDLIADVYEEPNEDDASNDATDNGKGNGSRTAQDAFGSSSHSKYPSASLAANDNINSSEEESHEYHNSSCTTCDPSFKSTVESFLTYILECFMLKLIDLDYFVKCFSKNREYIFLFFVDLLDVLVGEIIEE